MDDVRETLEKQGAGQAMFRVKSWKVETRLGYEVMNQNRSITLSAGHPKMTAESSNVTKAL